MIKILLVGLSSVNGGIEKIMFDIYKNMDKSIYKFDFIAFNGTVFNQDFYIDNGSKVFPITKRSNNPFKHYTELKKFFKSVQYDYVWVNTSSSATIATQKYAKKYTNAKIITHSHGTTFEQSGGIIDKLNCLTDKFNRKKMIKLTDLFFACSTLAGVSLFGESKRNEIILVQNGIDLEKFSFDQNKRNSYREKHNINHFVVGYIGRLAIQKNPVRMIQIFAEVLKCNSDVTLLMAGDGPLRNRVEETIKKHNITSNVTMLGNIDNADEMLNACDVLVMPSLFEGLPIVAIEAQCSGVPVIFADTISKEAVLLNNSIRLSLEEKDEVWGKMILEAKSVDRNIAVDIVKEKGYDIVVVAEKLKAILV